MREPVIGEKVYVRTSWYLDHGRDDFDGGVATVKATRSGTSLGEKVPFVELEERPGHWYNWEILMETQEKLKAEFGDHKARQNPDMHPDSNRDMGWHLRR